MLNRRSSTSSTNFFYYILSVPSTQPAVLHGRRLSQPSARSARRARVAWARIPREYAWQQCHSLSRQHYEPCAVTPCVLLCTTDSPQVVQKKFILHAVSSNACKSAMTYACYCVKPPICHHRWRLSRQSLVPQRHT